ncbi:LAME_0H04940g1_1 [Lachancea meyersii CBS 8951]|uniref:LAME_0H04940g1_1 n=1 Tax=Lachancea meyersii CBS 8951 TaxID=1266667 RepID=A0A1G4KE38_9SACH|nr:LAME_0H04940g1_1 [Lachancea meyersii CBS 8951]
MTNLLLQDPFTVLKEYPERLTQTFETPLQTCCVEFSHGGDYLAMGCSNGAVILYDMDTAKPIAMLGNRGGGHVRSIQSIAWSKDDRYILTSSRDWYVKLWDLQKPGVPARQVRFESPVWTCQWGGPFDLGCIATVYEEEYAFSINLTPETPVVAKICDVYEYLGEDEKESEENEELEQQDFGYTLVACVHPVWKEILITGTSKGWFKIYRISDQKVQLVHSYRFAYSNAKHMIISQSGDRVAINSSDRTIRQYSLTANFELTEFNFALEHRYQDVINRLQWNSIRFSSNSAEYLVASAHGSSARDLYLWETSTGTLVRVLEGAEEELMDIDWDFNHMCITSNGLETGNVYVWSLVIPPKWSALAPDFEEVEENIEYREKEDEFDQVGQFEQQQELDQAEEVKIDLRTREKFDVRGNEINFNRFVIPLDYDSILMLKHWDK